MKLKARLFDIHQGQNEVVLNEEQAKELSIHLLDRVKLSANNKTSIAIADSSRAMVKHGEIGVFAEVAAQLNLRKGQAVKVEATHRPQSLDYIRKKLDGEILKENEINSIITDLMAERLSTAELSAFISGVYTRGMTAEETVALTKAIYASGGSLKLKSKPVVSEHSIGGVAGDRISMLIVPIIGSLGICIPKTCSRAISTMCATADVMEVLCPVDLDLKAAQKAVNKTNAILIWGGAVNMAAADDKLIHIRKPLHLDPKALLLSSILAKKKAEGAEFVLLDLPIRGVKLDSLEQARELAKNFEAIGRMLGMRVQCSITDGSEPLINTIGPVFEARAVLETLKGGGHPALKEKACVMSGILLSMIRGVTHDEGYRIARQQIESGKALKKFREIIKVQGGNPNVEPEDLKPGKYKKTIHADKGGRIGHVDNKSISRVGRAAGSPTDQGAGIVLEVMKGDRVKKGDALLTVYSNNKDKLERAFNQVKGVIEIERVVIDVV